MASFGLERRMSLTALRLRKLAWLVPRPRYWGLAREGLGPSLEHERLLDGRVFGSVVDVGANVGQFALWAGETMRPLQIVCIEPQAEAAEAIRRLATRLPCRVDVIEAALGAASGRATLCVTEHNDSSSLLDPEASSALRVTERRDVAVTTGDEAVRPFELPAPLLVKIDVQGTENEVLEGMPDLLARAEAVLVEVSFAPMYKKQSDPSAVVARLLDRGLRFSAAARVPGTGSAWSLEQADLLFERRSRGDNSV